MIQARFSTPLRMLVGAIVGTLLTLLSAGCQSNKIDPQEAIRQQRPVAMRGESEFLGGDVVASVTVSRGYIHEKTLGERGFRQSESEQLMEQISRLNPEDKTYYQDIGRILNLEVRGSHLPPIAARLRLSNRTKREIEVEVPEFNSVLGNFSVQPRKVKLAPEEAVELEPMSSLLGAASDTIPIKVTLRADGRTDSHDIVVKSVVAAAPAATGR